jgi:hypothetical protein
LINHTTDAQRGLIVEWLSVPYNFALITGSAAQNSKVQSGKKLTKTAAYNDLADYVNKKSKVGYVIYFRTLLQEVPKARHDNQYFWVSL